MDSITHTLFGFTSFGAVKKEQLATSSKRALLFAALVGSQIPDIDVILNLTEVGRINAQLWHRGLTHSLFMAPIWAGFIYVLCLLFWKVKDVLFFKIAFINVLIHIGSDSLNTWGTGVLEPFWPTRVSFGTLSIIDFVIWLIILTSFILTKRIKNLPSYQLFRYAWLVIGLHIGIQSLMGYFLYQQLSTKYEHVALKSDFIPWNFTIIGKKGERVEISTANLFSGFHLEQTLISKESADLSPLLAQNPKAGVLMRWSPFVVIVDDNEKLGVLDPRFYQNGQSFLYEFISKDELKK